jgi:hypothetical protein
MKPARVLVAGCVVAFGLTACSHAQTVATTPSDRAACGQVEVAYAALNAWNGGPPPTSQYRHAIAVAAHAHNLQLSDAISDWMTAVIDPQHARPATDAAYTMEECRQIGVPLHFTASRTRNPSSPSTGDSEGSDDD